MMLLLDIGNTHTHVGLGGPRSLRILGDLPTSAWNDGTAPALLEALLGRRKPDLLCFCSVVPRVNTAVTE